MKEVFKENCRFESAASMSSILHQEPPTLPKPNKIFLFLCPQELGHRDIILTPALRVWLLELIFCTKGGPALSHKVKKCSWDINGIFTEYPVSSMKRIIISERTARVALTADIKDSLMQEVHDIFKGIIISWTKRYSNNMKRNPWTCYVLQEADTNTLTC